MKQLTKYQTKVKLKKGDEVIVIAGSCKNQTGKIETIDRKYDRVFIAGVNIKKRHTRPTMSNQTGGIIDKVMPIHVSSIALVDPKTKKATRIGYKTDGDKKIRVSRRSGTEF